MSARFELEPEPLSCHVAQSIPCDHVCYTYMFTAPFIQSARNSSACLYDASIYCRGIDFFNDYRGRRLEKEDNLKTIDQIDCVESTRKQRQTKTKAAAAAVVDDEEDGAPVQDFSPEMKRLQYEFIRTNLHRLPELRKYQYLIWVEPNTAILDPRFAEICIQSGEEIIAKDDNRVVFYNIRSPRVQSVLSDRWAESNSV